MGSSSGLAACWGVRFQRALRFDLCGGIVLRIPVGFAFLPEVIVSTQSLKLQFIIRVNAQRLSVSDIAGIPMYLLCMYAYKYAITGLQTKGLHDPLCSTSLLGFSPQLRSPVNTPSNQPWNVNRMF